MSERLPEHESGLRRLMADASEDAYIAFKSLAEAQAHPDGVVVLEGDDGGQIFAIFPAAQVRCSVAALERLLRDLDHIAWPGNDTNASRVFYECRRFGAAIAGGMGGGTVTPEGWIHKEFRDLGLENNIRAVIRGQSVGIRMPSG